MPLLFSNGRRRHNKPRNQLGGDSCPAPPPAPRPQQEVFVRWRHLLTAGPPAGRRPRGSSRPRAPVEHQEGRSTDRLKRMEPGREALPVLSAID